MRPFSVTPQLFGSYSHWNPAMSCLVFRFTAAGSLLSVVPAMAGDGDGFSSFTILSLVHEAPTATSKSTNRGVLISIEDDGFIGQRLSLAVFTAFLPEGAG